MAVGGAYVVWTDTFPSMLPVFACRAEAYKAEEVQERMKELMPSVEYKRMDQGKAYLAKYLELDFNQEKMYNHGLGASWSTGSRRTPS